MGTASPSVAVVVSRPSKYSTYVGKTPNGPRLRSTWHLACVPSFGKASSVNFRLARASAHGGNGAGHDIGAATSGVARRRAPADLGAGGADGVGRLDRSSPSSSPSTNPSPSPSMPSSSAVGCTGAESRRRTKLARGVAGASPVHPRSSVAPPPTSVPPLSPLSPRVRASGFIYEASGARALPTRAFAPTCVAIRVEPLA